MPDTSQSEYISALFRDLKQGKLPPGAVCIYPGRRNQLYRFPSPFGDLVVKCFGRPGLINSLVYRHLRRSKAERSYTNSLALLKAGLSVPEPLAYKEYSRCGRLRESYFLCRFTEGDTIRFFERRPDCDQMLEALALEVRKFRRAGIWHKDFSPGNILVQTLPAEAAENSSSRYIFNYVDLNRMKFGDYDPRHTVTMFSRINDSLEQTLRFARAYERLTAAEPDLQVPGFLEKVAAGHRRFFEGKERKRRLRQRLRLTRRK